MPDRTAIATLRTVLRGEIEGHRTLLDVLGTEQAALREANSEAVIASAALKERHVRELEALARQRIELFLSSGIAIEANGLSTGSVPEPLATSLQQDWSTLIGVAAEAQRVNRLNGRLIARHRRHFDSALAALLHADGRAASYGADGQPERLGPGRSLASA